jgi:small subunit ribosomal protein S12
MSTFFQAAVKKRKSKRRIIRVPALKNCPAKKAVIVKIRTMKPKKPNSATRKVAKIRLCYGRLVVAQIPGMGHFLQEHAIVMVGGKRVRDLPGMHYRLVKGVADFTNKEVGIRRQARSKYGYANIKKKKRYWAKKTKSRKKKKMRMEVKALRMQQKLRQKKKVKNNAN